MKAQEWSWLVVSVSMWTVSAAGAQPPVGALAVDERQGDQYGWAVDYETSATAQAAALSECGAGCSVVLTFNRCGAYAADQDAGSTAVGWAESYDSGAGARQAALAECRARGGSGCVVRVWGCNGQVIEEGLNLDRAVRRQIQQGLAAAGFDPGGADGVFGPRTREAIRSWQSARSERATGYLDAPAAEALRSAPVAAGVPAASEAQQTNASPPASAELEGLFWQSIMNSTNPADFEAYLEQFPNGTFRRLAENRLSTLRAPTDDRLAVDGPGSEPAAASTAGTPPADARRPPPSQPIDFGDDTSEWARDDECDDPRFEGDGMAAGTVFQNRGRDATDCRRLYDAGRIRLFGVDLASGYIDFGDDTSDYAQDGECDDPRFEGDGMAAILLASDRGRDAADCRRLYDAGRIRLFGVNFRGVR